MTDSGSRLPSDGSSVLPSPGPGNGAARANLTAACWISRRQKMVRCILPLLMAATALSGCSRERADIIGALPELPGVNASATPRVNGKVGSTAAALRPEISLGTGAISPGTLTRPAHGFSGSATGDISLDFADTDIREIAAQILGNILKVNYTIDPAVHGTATLRTVRPVATPQLLPILQSLLGQNGAALVQTGGLYRVVPVAQAIAAEAAAGVAGSEIVTLRYASADNLAKVLQPFVGDSTKVTPEPGRNALIVSGTPGARENLLQLIQAFDVDVLAGQSYALLPVNGGDPKDFASALQDAFRAQSGGALSGLIRVLPMSRVGAVLVVSSEPRYIEQARRLYALIERTRRQTLRSWHVYYLQNSHAEDVGYVLQQAFTPNNVTAQPTSQLRAQSGIAGPGYAGGVGAAGLGQGGFAGMGGVGGIGGVGGLGGQSVLTGAGQIGPNATISPLAQVPQVAAQGEGQGAGTTSPLTGPLQPGPQETQAEAMRIIPDPQNNALLIYATEQENDTVDAMLRKVDIMPLQVRIDAVIAEVTLNDNLQYGTQFFFKSGGLNSILNFANQANVQTPSQAQLNLNFPGFFIGGPHAGGAPLAINALQQVTKVRVLSSPELLVLDNQPARLQVGQVVPYLSQQAQSTLTSNAPIINSVNYQQTGVILDVTPRVNTGGLVTLDIAQDVSDVASFTTPGGIQSPTFFTRNITSRVVVQDGQTIGLAGLISENASTGNQGIPWLKDVPLLGALVGNQNNTRQRTELLMLLTPHVIHDQRDARALTEDLRAALPDAAALPYQLNTLPASGSPDPNAALRKKLHLQ